MRPFSGILGLGPVLVELIELSEGMSFLDFGIGQCLPLPLGDFILLLLYIYINRLGRE